MSKKKEAKKAKKLMKRFDRKVKKLDKAHKRLVKKLRKLGTVEWEYSYSHYGD